MTLLGLTGLYLGVVNSLQVFVEDMHAFNHVAHKRSLLGEVFSDGSPIPLEMGFYLCITAGLILLTERWASGRRAEAALRIVLPACTTGYLTLHVVLGAWLRVADIQYVQQAAGRPATDFFLWVNALGLMAANAGVLLMLLYLWRPREIWLVGQIALAYAGALGIAAMFPAELFRRLPFVHPSILRVSCAFAVIVAIGVVLRRHGIPLVARLHHPHTPMLLAASWSWAAFFMCSGLAIGMFHCMCVVIGYEEIQADAGRLVTMAALCLWTLVVVVQIGRGWCRRQSGRAEDTVVQLP